jgi:hypothetical protein
MKWRRAFADEDDNTPGFAFFGGWRRAAQLCDSRHLIAPCHLVLTLGSISSIIACFVDTLQDVQRSVVGQFRMAAGLPRQMMDVVASLPHQMAA